MSRDELLRMEWVEAWELMRALPIESGTKKAWIKALEDERLSKQTPEEAKKEFMQGLEQSGRPVRVLK